MMKKAIATLLILLIVPLSAECDTSEKYIGTWIHYQPTSITSRQYIIYELDRSGKAYFSKETFYTDGTQSVIETDVCTWEDTGRNIIITNDSGYSKELYYIDASKLSSDKQGISGIYNRVLLTESEYEAASSAPLEVVNTIDSPEGRWTIAEDYSEISLGYMMAKTDLIFFGDGNVFRFTVTKKNHSNDITMARDCGIWIGDSDNMVIRFDNITFTAYIDRDGFLYLKDGDSSVQFMKIQNNKEEK